MSILNNRIITIDAVLTRKGREILAKNDGSFKITQFALSDDEIDYTLYNINHPSGSAYYGEAIENTPILEAFLDDSQVMKYKLVTLPRGTSKIPIINLGYNSIVLKQGASLTITPQTLNYLGSTSVYESGGYSATISDIRLLSNFTGVGISNNSNSEDVYNVGTKLSKTVIGTSFTLTGTNLNTLFNTQNSITCTLTIIGRDSGARITVPININKNNQ